MNELAAIANDELLHQAVEEDGRSEEVPCDLTKKRKPNFVLVFWVDTKQFNVMALSRIPKDAREEGKMTKMKAEGQTWTVKLLQISENKKDLEGRMDLLIAEMAKKADETYNYTDR